jgi:hypothetical protein
MYVPGIHPQGKFVDSLHQASDSSDCFSTVFLEHGLAFFAYCYQEIKVRLLGIPYSALCN